ncbi:MAG: MerR family transcriptional regulator [Synergistaceae bacterium]|nr:MerR family transcriptional regulator [Synergistaceae bacterium]MBR0074927.1 MerR family transcriptional regulator [Synergistaceae bacterium]
MPYTIKDISELTGLPASTLRYYDKQGLLPGLKRNENNIRIFTDEDYGFLRIIECLKKSGLSIKDIKKFIDLYDKGDSGIKERQQIFVKRRKILLNELKNLQEILSIIDYKCWYYEKACREGTESGLKNLKNSDIPEKFRKARELLHKK